MKMHKNNHDILAVGKIISRSAANMKLTSA